MELNDITINITTEDRGHIRSDLSPSVIITIKQGDKEIIEKTSYESLAASGSYYRNYGKDNGVEALTAYIEVGLSKLLNPEKWKIT